MQVGQVTCPSTSFIRVASAGQCHSEPQRTSERSGSTGGVVITATSSLWTTSEKSMSVAVQSRRASRTSVGAPHLGQYMRLNPSPLNCTALLSEQPLGGTTGRISVRYPRHDSVVCARAC